jgi:ABC-type Fe3+-hydroxamate transport system, periplasmic component
MRVISLLPSATELCYALNVEPVGVSHECDYPPQAQTLPTVIHARVDADGTSQEINEQVGEAVETGGVYELDRERLAALDPDVILSQGTCEVCAVDDSNVRRAVTELDLDTAVVTTDPHSLGDVLADVERIGERFGREERAAELVTEYRKRIERVERATPADGPETAVLDWLDPAMVAGHWVPGMVERAGGSYGLADPGERSRPREWSEIRASDPEVLVASPCGFGLNQTVRNVGDLTARQGWSDLTAVEQGRVYLVDGNQYVNRPGPRLVETLELLAGILHPGAEETLDPADHSGVRRFDTVVDGRLDHGEPA